MSLSLEAVGNPHQRCSLEPAVVSRRAWTATGLRTRDLLPLGSHVWESPPSGVSASGGPGLSVVSSGSFFFFLIYFFAALGLRCCERTSRCGGLSLLQSTGSRCAGLVVVAHGLSCSTAHGIFPNQGSNPCPLHWQVDS